MKLNNNLDCSLVNNHSSEKILFNKKVLENRARSVSSEFIGRYDDESCRLYLYDLIAYIVINNKGSGEIIDDEIIILLTLSEYIDGNKDEEDKEFICLNKERYEDLIEKLTFGKISLELFELLINLYIYNEAYIENDFLIKTGLGNVSELESRNKSLLEAKSEIKKRIIPDAVKCVVEKYTVSYKKKNGQLSKVHVVRHVGKKNTVTFKYKNLSGMIGLKDARDLSSELKNTYWVEEKKKEEGKKTTVVKTRKKENS